jgi:hypothetical protein
VQSDDRPQLEPPSGPGLRARGLSLSQLAVTQAGANPGHRNRARWRACPVSPNAEGITGGMAKVSAIDCSSRPIHTGRRGGRIRHEVRLALAFEHRIEDVWTRWVLPTKVRQARGSVSGMPVCKLAGAGS